MRFALVCGAGIPTLRGAFLSAKRASERKSLPRSEFRRVIAVERHASLFSSAYVCVKKGILRVRMWKEESKVRSRSVGFCDEQREANACFRTRWRQPTG